MKRMVSRRRWLPGLVILSGLAWGCGGGGSANLPPPKPATPEQGKQAADDVRAGMPKDMMKAPGVNP